ncbi:MAG: hypothetical protein HOO19_03005 [Rhodospirillaceae bacterium]|jgi:hypothetical protein|nr:hypothetical protein [Rhodospirillaceae bacterium]MBT3886548.1 hypothetical protein [Rhodospirillaceae bacterium]MBT4117883.1 hypothetical protein [Rhodospirillaceae bacterium]MBT4671131.1 hypothetical protein [Rhodospirillaceae bacterium]MBT4718263.1 hypothetical protein [Rhodospirillaceae bacterium]
MSLMIPGSGNDGRVAAYGPAMFGAGVSAGAAASISETAFGGAMEAGLSGGGAGPGAAWPRMTGTSEETGPATGKPKFQAFMSAFHAQLIFQQTASFKPTKAVALATMVADTYQKIMTATRPDGLAQAVPASQNVIDGPGVNFLA